ncbi:MAG: beta-lactamase family protein [Alphaproteobacteria bacterium]|nr:beta-lactamase family protein [Alphaproteobacteria bacterium]
MTVEIQGFCEPRFKALEEAFRANFEAGLEVGASVAATWKGRPVVDLWAGHRDAARTRPWEKDTIVQVRSLTKIATTLSFFMLIDRGLVDIDAPVARYWPEFAAGGKAHVTVREALTNRAGVPGFDPPITSRELADWGVATSNLANATHWFEGRPKMLYHGITYGLILGEIMRRVDGRKPSQFFREEIADRAHIDFQLPLRSESDLKRSAEIVFTQAPQGEHPDPLVRRLGQSIRTSDPDEMKTWEFLRHFEEPSAGGYSNGRALARMGAIAALGGTLDGIRYFSPKLSELAATEQAYEYDNYLASKVSMGLGCFGLASAKFQLPPPRSFHWGGAGGSLAMMDATTQLSFGYAMNRFMGVHGDARQLRFWDALRAVSADL